MTTTSNASEVYTRLLLPKGHGCPIWCPEPDENLSLAYREGGVRIGHVGRIVPDGGFDPLFNVCAPADDPINSEGVPEGFEQLVLEDQDVSMRSRYHNRGSHICSDPLEKKIDATPISERNVAPSSPSYQFTSNAATTEGAALLLPEGAARRDLRGRKAQFRQHAMENALRWYQFANQNLDREIPNGSLILVTGCDQAFLWGIASFSGVSSDVDVELSFKPTSDRTYSWETNIVSATVRTSPGHESISASNGGRELIVESSVDARHGTFTRIGGNQINITNITVATIGDNSPVPHNTSSDITEGTSSVVNPSQEHDGSSQNQNQCVFIRGFRISIQDGIFAAAFRGPLEISNLSDSVTQDIFGSQRSSLPFSPPTASTRTRLRGWFDRWSGGGDKSQAPTACSDRISSREQRDVPDAVLDPISTTSEPCHPFKTIQRYLLDTCPEAMVAVMHDDDLVGLMKEHDNRIPEEEELHRRLRIQFTPVTSAIPRGSLPSTWKAIDDEPRGVYLQENHSDIADDVVVGSSEWNSLELLLPDVLSTSSDLGMGQIVESASEAGRRRALTRSSPTTGMLHHAVLGHLLSPPATRTRSSKGLDAIPSQLETQAQQREAEARRQFLSQTLLARAVKDTSYDMQGKHPCDDDTRVDILVEIRKWIYNVSTDSQTILWLTGDPGSGKSAITASVARECEDADILWAQFFINRNNPDTTNPRSFFPSIARQLVDHYPDSDVALAIHDALKRQPSLMDDISQNQADRLFVEAMAVASKVDLSKPVVVVIDGLDEIDRSRLRETAQILSKIFNALYHNAKLLISSRTEDDIQKQFAPSLDVKYVKHVHLDTSASIQDVSDFLRRKIAGIVRQNDLDWMEWPGVERVEGLCVRAAGLFIWAVTAAKFIQQTLETSGTECLDVVLDTDGMGDINSLYGAILRYTSDHWVFEGFRRVVGFVVVLREPLCITDIGHLLNLRQTPATKSVDVEHLVRRLRTVLVDGTQAIDGQTVPRLPKSFFEFITSERADPRFRIDRDISNGELAIQCLHQLSSLYNEHVKLSNKDSTGKAVTSLSGPLRYALRFWSSHLPGAEVSTAGIAVTANNIRFPELGNLLRTSVNDSHSQLGVTFSSESMRILTSWDNVIRDWDSVSGRPIERPILTLFAGHTSFVYSVAFSPDGKSIVSGSGDHTVRLWESQNGQPIGTPFKGHPDVVYSVAFSPDGKSIVSGSRDHTIRLWESQSGQPIGKPFKGHTSSVYSVAFSPDGKSIVSGSGDHTVRLWESHSGQTIGTPFKGHTAAVRSVAFSPDGKSIVSGGEDCAIRLWESHSGQPIGMPFKGHTRFVYSVAFSPDGKSIVSGSFDHTVRLWDSQSGHPVGMPFKGHTDCVDSVAFSPDGKSIISGSYDHTVRRWESQTGQPIGMPFKGHTHAMLSVAFSPDGKSIVSGSSNRTIQLWESQSGRPIMRPFLGHTKLVTSTIVSSDSTQVISTSSDNTIRFWDLKTGMQNASALADEYTKDIISASLSPDGIRIAAVSPHGTVGLWDVASRQLVSCIKGSINGVTSLSFSPSGTQLILNCVDGPTWIWNPRLGTLTEIPQSLGEERALFFDMKQGWSNDGTDDSLLQWWPDSTSVGSWAYVDGKVIRSNGRGSLNIVDTRTGGASA